MNAQIVPISPALALSAERRRDVIIGNVAHALSVHEHALRTRAPTLGPATLRVELQATASRLRHELARLESVIADLSELESESEET